MLLGWLKVETRKQTRRKKKSTERKLSVLFNFLSQNAERILIMLGDVVLRNQSSQATLLMRCRAQVLQLLGQSEKQRWFE